MLTDKLDGLLELDLNFMDFHIYKTIDSSKLIIQSSIDLIEFDVGHCTKKGVIMNDNIPYLIGTSDLRYHDQHTIVTYLREKHKWVQYHPARDYIFNCYRNGCFYWRHYKLNVRLNIEALQNGYMTWSDVNNDDICINTNRYICSHYGEKSQPLSKY